MISSEWLDLKFMIYVSLKYELQNSEKFYKLC